MKKLLLILVQVLFLSNIVFAGAGVGNIKLSENVIENFYNYIKSTRFKRGSGDPIKFLVTEDGKNSVSWFCPYEKCSHTGSQQEEKKCFERFGKQCFTFAINRGIVWKNDYVRSVPVKQKRFSRKDDFYEIKDKLDSLGFIDSYIDSKIDNENINEPSSENLIDQLKQLSELYKSGVLTKKEFEKAKNKLLN